MNFTNLLADAANPNNAQQGKDTPATDPNWKGLFNDDQVAGRCAGFHATGTELVSSMADNGAMVGSNDGNVGRNAGPQACGDPAKSGLVAPGQIPHL